MSYTGTQNDPVHLTFLFTSPSSFRFPSSLVKVSSSLESAFLTVPTQRSEWTPNSDQSLVGGGVLSEGRLYDNTNTKENTL